jgi:hypothetical protein
MSKRVRGYRRNVWRWLTRRYVLQFQTINGDRVEAGKKTSRSGKLLPFPVAPGTTPKDAA